MPPMPTWCLVVVWLLSALTAALTLPSDEGKDLAELVQEDERCRPEFVDRFLRLLSAPAGSEADQFLISVLRLLSDRSHDTDTDVTSGHLALKQGENAYIEKRLKPEFNPTGWRRKRDVASRLTMRRVLQSLYDTLGNRDGGSISAPSWQKRNTRGRFRSAVPKPKRKPLEFNPTGW